MTTLSVPSSVPLESVCAALRLAGLEPDPRQHRGCLTFRSILPAKITRDPAATIRAAARRAEVRT